MDDGLSSMVLIMTQLSGLLWFVLMIVPLILLQRLLHREIQAVLLILTRDVNITMGIFSVIFFPGILLHELSHFVMAKILRVPTGRFSLIPHSLPDGRLQLGYVETARSDLVRDSLIGAAPLIVGTLFVAYVAVERFDMRLLWEVLRNGQFSLFWMGLGALPNVGDFYLWFYLVFAVSSTMMPSESDRHAWLELAISIGVLFAVTLLLGAGPWLMDNLAPQMNNFFGFVAAIFGLSSFVHILLILPTALVHRLVSRLTGLDIQ